MRDVRGEVWWDGAMWCAVGNDVDEKYENSQDAEDDNAEAHEDHDDA